jgi:hypothetical protein
MLNDVRDRLDEWAEQLERFASHQRRARHRLSADVPWADWQRTVDRYRALEEHYLILHSIFRRQGYHIPDPGWRSSYVERVLDCGFSTKLGD